MSKNKIDEFEALKLYILALSDDIQVKILKHYIAFKKIKNFACLEVHYTLRTVKSRFI
nr:DUF5655 domain-containing protein [Bacillus toyonensis]